MSNQLADLSGHQLVKRSGPAPKSKMYEITPKGRAVVRNAEKYNHHSHQKFTDLINKATDNYENSTPTPKAPFADVYLADIDYELLRSIAEAHQPTVSALAKTVHRRPCVVRSGAINLQRLGLTDFSSSKLDLTEKGSSLLSDPQ